MRFRVGELFVLYGLIDLSVASVEAAFLAAKLALMTVFKTRRWDK